MKLISQEVIDKYVLKSLKSHIVVFKYLNDSELEIGLISDFGETVSDVIKLPTVLDNGMLSLNGKTWYPPKVLLPPTKSNFHNKLGIRYLNYLVNISFGARKLNDFIPRIDKYDSYRKLNTPLFKELSSNSVQDARNLYNWNVLSIEYLIVELFNHKINFTIDRLQRKGNKGMYPVKKSLLTLINNSLRYYDNDINDYHEYEYEIKDKCFTESIFINDKLDTVILPEFIHNMQIMYKENPVDFCSCSQNSPGSIAHFKDGIKVENCKIVSKATFPYSRTRRGVVGLLSDDPNRVIVSKNISRSLPLASPDIPLVRTDFPYSIDSISLPGIQMTHPLNCEDGIIVSETFASKMSAFKKYVSTIIIPENCEIRMKVDEIENSEEAKFCIDLNDHIKGVFKDLVKSNTKCVVKPKDILFEIDMSIPLFEYDPQNPTMSYKTDENGNVIDYIKTKKIKSKSAYKSVVLSIEDIEQDKVNDSARKIIIEYVSYLPLSVGDKISDGHGNKATISSILSDYEMPTWEDRKVHYIATPFRAKRLAFGAEIEDKLCIVAESKGEDIVVPSDKIYSQEEINSFLQQHGSYTGTVNFQGEIYEDIPLSMRRLYRLDNNAKESLSYAGTLNSTTGNNVKLGLDIVSLMSRGAMNIVFEYLKDSHKNIDFKEKILPILNVFNNDIPKGAKTYIVHKRIDNLLLGTIMNYKDIENMKRKNTAVDERNETSYGILTYKDRLILLPPKTAFNKVSFGQYTFNNIATAFNNILCDIISEDQGYEVNVERRIDSYFNSLAAYLSGKDGKIKSTLMPVLPINIRAVASNYVSENPYQIAIPRKAYDGLKRQNSQFKNKYDKTGKCLLKRDPVHGNNSFFAVDYVVWNNDTIGIPPWLMILLSGDFDGDAVCTSFPIMNGAIENIDLLYPTIPDSCELGKQFVSDNNHPYDALMDNTGYGSTFDNLSENDIIKNTELYEDIISGKQNLDHLNIIAMRNFSTIKHGTAHTGAIGLRSIYTQDLANRDQITDMMNFYHAIAQNTLDAKSGIEVPAKLFVDYYRSKETKTNRKYLGIKKSLSALGISDKVIDIVYEQSRLEEKSDSVISYLSNNYPVLSTIQQNSSAHEIEMLAHKYKSGEISGGIFESMFKLLTKYSEDDNWIEELSDIQKIL